jgi:glycosyltransferase involved in cell wall biosynthesis
VNFIKGAIDGFLMQETTFPVEIIIRDDASSDGTVEILRNYQEKFPQLIRTILHTENQYSQGKKAFPETFAIARGEFIALCEGDDYWTSPRKLHEQEIFLSQDKRVAIISHGCQVVDEKGTPLDWGRWVRAPIGGSMKYTDKDVLEACYDHPNTWLFRAELADEKCRTICHGLPMGDDPMHLYFLQEGRIGISLGHVWSTYRQHAGGIWSQRSEFERRIQELVLFKRHQSVYGAKYRTNYNALIAQKRATLVALTFINVRKFKYTALMADFSYIKRFSSNTFHAGGEWTILFFGALAMGIERARTKLIRSIRSGAKYFLRQLGFFK